MMKPEDEDRFGDLGPELGSDRSALLEVADRLERERPVPKASFRGNLRRSLVATRAPATRPRHLRLLIAGYAGSGLLLLALAVAGLGGSGPFAA